MVLANVPVKELIVAFYSPSEVLVLPPYYTKVSYCGSMTCGVAGSHIREGTPKVFFKPLPNVLQDSPIYSSSNFYLSHLNLCITPLFLVMWSLVLGSHQEVLDGISSSQKCLNPMFSTYLFKILTQALGIWCYYICLLTVGGTWCVVMLSSTTVIFIRIRLDFVLHHNVILTMWPYLLQQ